HVVEVNKPFAPKRSLVFLNQCGRLIVITVPFRRIAIKVCSSIFVESGSPALWRCIRTDYLRERFFERSLLFARQSYCNIILKIEPGQSRVGQDDMLQAKGMDGAHEYVSALLDAELFQAAAKLPRTLRVERDARDAARRLNVLGKHLRHLYRERLRLAAAWPGEDDAIAL